MPAGNLPAMRVLIDGQPVADGDATISVFDWGLQRGYGAFELIRSYAGKPFRAREHVERLHRSLEIMRLIGPDMADVEEWVHTQAAAGGDCFVRVLVTAGSRDPLFGSPSRTIVLWEEMPDAPEQYRLLPLPGPWHAGGVPSELTGAKTLSYAPNMASMLEAQRQGYHDALLLARDTTVLEGPTFTAAWVTDGVLEVPALDLGILASITRQAAIEVAAGLGVPVSEGAYTLAHVLAADEVIALSTVREVAPVVEVGDAEFAPGPVTAKLAAGFADLVERELG